MTGAVGLNLVFWIAGSGGVGRYAGELLAALRRVAPGLRLTAFVSRDHPAELRRQAWAEGIEWVVLPVPGAGGGAAGSATRIAAQWAVIPAVAARRRLDVIHGLANVNPVLSPRVRSVVTFHDLIWTRHPGTMDAFSRRAMRATALPSVRRADRVITASSVVRDELVGALGLDPARVDVVPHGVRGPSVAPDHGVAARLGIAGRPVVLCVAQKRTHKNLEALVRALPSLADDAVVVLPGAPTAYETHLRELAAAAGVAGRLVLPAWVTEAELEGLYAAATVFALPSLDEGFGLPVLEAMARGVPVACSDATSLPEVAGDAAELFDPRSGAAVVAALRRLLGDPGRRAELAARGRARAAHFTWDRSARLTVEAYERA